MPVVLLDAPLGTYLGWNITARGDEPFHKGQICNYVGGMIPFARSAAERQANSDPRPSLEERYGSTTVMSSGCARPRHARWSRGSCCPATRRC